MYFNSSQTAYINYWIQPRQFHSIWCFFYDFLIMFSRLHYPSCKNNFLSHTFSPSSFTVAFFPTTPISTCSSLSPASRTEIWRRKGKEGEREGSESGVDGEGRCAVKVPPWVEHGHLSSGWKLKKRLVNLYSGSPWDTGINTAKQNASSHRCIAKHTHTHTHSCKTLTAHFKMQDQ